MNDLLQGDSKTTCTGITHSMCKTPPLPEPLPDLRLRLWGWGQEICLLNKLPRWFLRIWIRTLRNLGKAKWMKEWMWVLSQFIHPFSYWNISSIFRSFIFTNSDAMNLFALPPCEHVLQFPSTHVWTWICQVMGTWIVLLTRIKKLLSEVFITIPSPELAVG